MQGFGGLNETPTEHALYLVIIGYRINLLTALLSNSKLGNSVKLFFKHCL